MRVYHVQVQVNVAAETEDEAIDLVGSAIGDNCDSSLVLGDIEVASIQEVAV